MLKQKSFREGVLDGGGSNRVDLPTETLEIARLPVARAANADELRATDSLATEERERSRARRLRRQRRRSARTNRPPAGWSLVLW